MIQRSPVLAQQRPPRLIGLLWGNQGYYAYGDSEKRIIEPRPVGTPCLIVRVPSDVSYSMVATMLEPIVPAHGNAFITSAPFLFYQSRHYDLAFQLFTIPDHDYQRVIGLPRDDRMLEGYIKEWEANVPPC